MSHVKYMKGGGGVKSIVKNPEHSFNLRSLKNIRKNNVLAKKR